MTYTAQEGDAGLDDLFTSLVRVETRLYNAVAERVKAAADFSAGHFEFLRHLRDHPDARVADLAGAFAIGVGATSKIVDRLEQRGWVARAPNPANRRSSLLALTPEGDAAVSRVEPVWQAALRDVFGTALAGDEMTTLTRSLDALRADLERRHLGLPAG